MFKDWLKKLYSVLSLPIRWVVRNVFVYKTWNFDYAENKTPAEKGLKNIQEEMLTTEDGVKICMWRSEYLDPAKPTVLFFHKTHTTLCSDPNIKRIQELQTKGFNVAMIDYRGYGKSKGNPSEEGLYKDAEAAVTRLKSGKDLIVMGESLGTGVAVEMAKRHNFIKKLVLISPFTSLPECFPGWARPFLIEDVFDSKAKIKEVAEKVEVAIFHGKKDTYVPYSHAEALQAAASGAKYPVRVEEIEDAGHRMKPHHRETIWGKVAAWIGIASTTSPEEQSPSETEERRTAIAPENIQNSKGAGVSKG